jgi:hypothetical protein
MTLKQLIKEEYHLLLKEEKKWFELYKSYNKSKYRNVKGGYNAVNRPQVYDLILLRIKKGPGHTSGTEGLVYHVSPSGQSFKLEDFTGNKNPKEYFTDDFKRAKIKRLK